MFLGHAGSIVRIVPYQINPVNSAAVLVIVIKRTLEFDQAENDNAASHANSQREYFGHRTDWMLQDIP